MIKVSVLYPNTPGVQFDEAYYLNTHMGLVKERLGSKLLGYSVESGIKGSEAGDAPTYIIQCSLYFESMESLAGAMAGNDQALTADVPNFTNVTPIQQISRVLAEDRVN